MLHGEVSAERAGERQGLPGVAVSDGATVARTDARGRFALPAAAPDRPLVWISVPSGWRPVSPWYLPAGARLRFRLRPEPQPAAFSFLYFTDVHLPPERSLRAGFLALLSEFRSLHPPPAFAIAGGDIDLQAGVGLAYRRAVRALPWPVHQALGNHDLLVREPDPRAAFRRLFGPTYYSFNYGGAHFVVLDGLRAVPEKPGWRSVEGELSERELTWLEQDLAAAEAPLTLAFSHIPPVSSFPLRRGRAPGEEPAWELRRASELLAVCRGRVRQIYAGHMHENERVRAGDLEVITTAAVCGQWWERGGRPPFNLDGTPNGYRRIFVAGSDASSHYLPTGDPDHQLRIVGPRPGQEAGETLAIGVNVFDGAPETEVEYSLAGGPWLPLRWTPQRKRPRVYACAHFWAARADLSRLPEGEHLLTVRAHTPGGRVPTEQVRFRKRSR